MLKKLNFLILTLVAVGSFVETSFADSKVGYITKKLRTWNNAVGTDFHVMGNIESGITKETVKKLRTILRDNFDSTLGYPILKDPDKIYKRQADRIYRGLKSRADKQAFIKDLEGVVDEVIAEQNREPRFLDDTVTTWTRRVLNKWDEKTHGTVTYAQAKPKGGKGSR